MCVQRRTENPFNFFQGLPAEISGTIYSYLDPASQKSFCVTDKNMNILQKETDLFRHMQKKSVMNAALEELLNVSFDTLLTDLPLDFDVQDTLPRYYNRSKKTNNKHQHQKNLKK